MGRESYRSGGTPPPEMKPTASPSRRETQRVTPRRNPAKADRVDETSYTHVRQDLLRIALLALGLFALLILVRVATTTLGLLP